MARVLALVPDLLFGSRVQGALATAGHDIELVSSTQALHERLAPAGENRAAVLVVDLTDASFDGAAAVESLARDGTLGGTRTLAFYSHVDPAARERAQQAGFDLVVPRSRMAREGAELVGRLAQGASAAR